MDEIKIQKNIKIPKSGKGGGGRPSKYPFDKLQVGDSFFSSGINTRYIIYSSLRAFNANTKSKRIDITTRAEGDGIRVWRIK